ncbi:MAG: GH32 C-terminal domain-containing protein, partial [Thermoguttaceae bacterium]|nr:GH32 C-terminal domain-containing protein [Thermoguttaceae bacterium]
SWMSGGVYPNMPFNQQFSVPRELTLRTTPDGIRLCTNPVVELESLRGDSLRKTDIALGEKTEIPIFDDELLDLVMTVKPGNAKKLTFDIRGQKFEFLLDEKQVVSGDVIAPAAPIDGKLTVRVLMDRMSMELFVNDGLTQIAQCFVPEDNASYPNLEVSSDGSDAVLENLEVWKLQSVYAK